MPYSQFTLAAVRRDFGLAVGTSTDLFASVPPVPPSPGVADTLRTYLPLALAQNNEKARSELLIAPLLADLWRQAGHRLAVFSGVELSVDPARSLTGVCDFLIAHPPQVEPVGPPILAVVEAKREDIPSGYGQCAAELVAALELNRQERTGRDVVYGCVSTGLEWRFLRLTGTALDIDVGLYLISDPARILGILLAVCGFGPAPLHPRPDAR